MNVLSSKGQDVTHPTQTVGARIFTHPSNNFDFVRIVAASCVLISHHFALTAQAEPSFFGLHSLGGIAVLIFFSLSGFLVAQSWFADPHTLRFAMRRALRIWPALTLAATLTVLLLGPLVTTLPLKDYLNHKATWDYFSILWMKVFYVLPGVFEKNPYALGVNGSLWTIPLEVRCYIVLGGLGLLGVLKRRAILVALVGVYFIWYFLKSSPDLYGSLHYGRELSAYFLAGAGWFCVQATWKKRPQAWLTFVLGCAAIAWSSELRYLAVLIGLPYLVVWGGSASTSVLHRAGRWGDPSYGLYLFAFPIQQMIIFYTWPHLGFEGTLCLALLLTTALAYASWHLIEKQALKFKPRKP